MKRFMIISLSILILISPVGKVTAKSTELPQIIAAVKEQSLSIDQWSVLYKEKVSADYAYKIIKLLDNKYKITSKDKGNSVIYSIGDSHNQSKSVERYTVVIPKDNQRNAEITAELKNHKWDSEVEEDYHKWQLFVSELLFTEKVWAYTCLTTEFNGIINSDYFPSYIMKKLDVKQTQTQIDKNNNSMLEKVVYGYTSLWEQEIYIKDVPMNFQLGVAKNKLGESQFIIGTPILINEY